MEFGFEPVLEPGRRPVRSQIPVCYLVADRSEAGRRPAASWNLAYSTSKQVCDQLRTCLRPDGVMEFGLQRVICAAELLTARSKHFAPHDLRLWPR